MLDGLPKDGSPLLAVVYGGREWISPEDAKTIWRILDKARAKYGLHALLEGKAKGVDRTAGQWAERCGVAHIEMGANWDHYGKGAGLTRNEWMVRCISPDYAIEFPGGNGTLDMRERLMARGIDIKSAKVAHPFYPDWKPI